MKKKRYRKKEEKKKNQKNSKENPNIGFPQTKPLAIMNALKMFKFSDHDCLPGKTNCPRLIGRPVYPQRSLIGYEYCYFFLFYFIFFPDYVFIGTCATFLATK